MEENMIQGHEAAIISSNKISIVTEYLKLYQEVKTGGRFNRKPDIAFTEEEKEKLRKNNDKSIVKRHRNTPSVNINHDWFEIVFREEERILTRIDLIKRFSSNVARVIGPNLIKVIESAIPNRLDKEDDNELKNVLLYVLALETLWS